MMRNAIGEEIPILCGIGCADHNVSHHCLQKVGLAHHQKVSAFNMSYEVAVARFSAIPCRLLTYNSGVHLYDNYR